MENFYHTIILKLYDSNKHLGFIDDLEYITSLSGKYSKWGNSLPENILFGIGGKILFTNDSIYVNESNNRYLYSSLVKKHKNEDLKLYVSSFLFSHWLSYRVKTEKDPLTTSLKLNELNFFIDVFNLFQEFYDTKQKEKEYQRKRKEEEDRKRYEMELMKKNKEIEKQRVIKLEKSKLSIISELDKDGNNKVDLIDSELFNKLLNKNQKSIVDIDKTYIQKFVKVSMYLKTKKSNTQKIFESIRDTKNDKELNELVNLLKNQIHTYELLVFHSINMVTSLVDGDLITFYEIYECFDQLGVFNSNWENEVSNKLNDIGSGIRDLMYSIYQMENKIVNSIDNLSYTTQESFRDLTFSVEKQLSSIDSTIKFNNLLTGIQTYQMYRINQNTKRLG